MKTEADHYTLDLLGNKPSRTGKPNVKRTNERNQRSTSAKPGSESFDPCPWCGVERSSCCGICNIGQLGHKG